MSTISKSPVIHDCVQEAGLLSRWVSAIGANFVYHFGLNASRTASATDDIDPVALLMPLRRSHSLNLPIDNTRGTEDMKRADQTARYIEEIKGLATTFDRLSGAFRRDNDQIADPTFDKFSVDYWRRNVYGNALVRLRQLSENNFNFVETLGLLAVSRYIFELSIWLRLFKKDSRYCLVYYKELLETQRRYFKDTLAQLHREIALLKMFEELDNPIDAASNAVGGGASVADYGDMVRNTMSRVDAEASRHFSLYLDDAKTNGYGFQAYLVGKKAVPRAEAAIAEIEEDLQEFGRHAAEDIRNLAKGKWQWRKMSEEAGIVHEHDFIYSFASKLLHATPASITTNMKNLERSETCMFLRYIHVKMLEIADLAHSQPECKVRAVG